MSAPRLINISAVGIFVAVFLLALIDFLPRAQEEGTQFDPVQLGTGSHENIPDMPVLRLDYAGRVFHGLPGASCWPLRDPVTGNAETLCTEAEFPNPAEIIPVIEGDAVIVTVQAHERPSGLAADVFDSPQRPPIASLQLAPGLAVPLTVNFPTGVYVVQITGYWPEGDVGYAFKIAVE